MIPLLMLIAFAVALVLGIYAWKRLDRRASGLVVMLLAGIAGIVWFGLFGMTVDLVLKGDLVSTVIFVIFVGFVILGGSVSILNNQGGQQN